MTLFRRFSPLLYILFIWFIFASPYFLKGLVPFPSRYLVTFFQPWQPYYGMPSKNNAMPDIITQIYPWRYQSIDSIKEGGWGLWNPYSFSGTVHAANYQSAPYFPFNFLFFILPFIDAWSFLVLLQPLASSVGMYLFLRSLERTKWSAVFGSIAFMFCGFMTSWMAYGTLGWAVAFLPYILFGINTLHHSITLSFKHSSNFSHWFSGCVISVAIGSSFLAGHFQMSLYVLLVALGYAIYCGKKTFVSSIPFIGLGLFFALPQIATAIDAFSRSARSENFILQAGIPWQYLITVFSPDFFGNPVTRNDWFGQYAEWASYIGILPLLFSIIGILYSRKENIFYVILACISLLIAVASPFSALFYQLQIPVLSTSVATRMIVIFSFSLIVLASSGFDTLLVTKNKIKKHILIAGTIIILGLLWSLPFLLIDNNPVYRQIAIRNMFLPTIFLLLGISTLLLSSINKLTIVIIIIVIVVTSFDLYRFTSKWMPFEERDYVFPSVPVVEFLRSNTNKERVFSNVGNEINSYFQIPSPEGYDAMYNARYGEFISAAADGTIKPLERSVVKIDRGGVYTKRWLDLLSSRYILHRLSDGRNVWVFPHWKYDSFKSVYKDDHYEVFENSQALPKSYLVGSYEVKNNQQEIVNTLIDKNFDIQSQVVLEKNIKEEIASGSGTVTIDRSRSGEVILRINTSSPQLLVRTETYDPGWKVFINGLEQELLRVNYTFQGVVVPEGEALVRFVYLPISFQIGVIGQIISLFVLGALSVRQLLHERRLL